MEMFKGQLCRYKVRSSVDDSFYEEQGKFICKTEDEKHYVFATEKKNEIAFAIRCVEIQDVVSYVFCNNNTSKNSQLAQIIELLSKHVERTIFCFPPSDCTITISYIDIYNYRDKPEKDSFQRIMPFKIHAY